MEKEAVLKHLSNAKIEYMQWIKRAVYVKKGFPVSQEQIPVEPTECCFGKWLKSEEGEYVGFMPGMDIFRTIETLHEQVHALYNRIFLIHGSTEKHPVLHMIPKLQENSLIFKMLTRRRRSTSFEKDIAVECFDELKRTSEQLVEAIDRLERRVHALPPSSFE